MRKQILCMMLCACVYASCDPNAGGGVFDEPIKPVEPPVEEPEEPTTPPSTEDLLTIKIEDDIMAVVGTNTWNAIAYGNGKYVAVGTNGYVTTSTDGKNWTTPEQRLRTSGKRIVYANGYFLVSLYFGSFSKSFDAETWTYTSRIGSNLSDWYDIVHGNGIWVAVGENGSRGYITSSADGSSWTEPTIHTEVETIYSVAYGNGKFIATGTGGYIFTSEDGQNWESVKIDAFRSILFEKIIYANGLFVACGWQYTDTYIGCIVTSTDGVTWSEPYKTEYSKWLNIAYRNGLFVCVGTNAKASACKSVDGKNWTLFQITDEDGNKVSKTLYDVIMML